jgi:hypothetical protein
VGGHSSSIPPGRRSLVRARCSLAPPHPSTPTQKSLSHIFDATFAIFAISPAFDETTHSPPPHPPPHIRLKPFPPITPPHKNHRDIQSRSVEDNPKSLGVFAAESFPRAHCIKLVEDARFNNLILVSIILNCMMMAVLYDPLAGLSHSRVAD